MAGVAGGCLCTSVFVCGVGNVSVGGRRRDVCGGWLGDTVSGDWTLDNCVGAPVNLEMEW